MESSESEIGLDAVVLQACDRCHGRKTRCDKSRPECGSCRKSQATCIYSDRTQERMYTRAYVQRLERRIHRLEATIRTLSLHKPDKQATTSTATATASQASHDHPGQPSSSHDNTVASQISFLSVSAGGDDPYFIGSTSGTMLASLVMAGLTIDPGNAAIDPSPDSEATASEGGANKLDNTSGIDPPLPSEQVTHQLVEAYLSHDHPCYPFLHPQAVWATVDRMYNDATFKETHKFETFMFYMIMAIVTSHDYIFSWHGLASAETYQRRAMVRLGSVLSQGGLRALQAMLLLCHFRMVNPTMHTSGALWHTVGIAARMCFELGLHREDSYHLINASDGIESMSPLSPKLQANEVRRRCFWSVFALDRIVSITLGRPLAIPSGYYNVQLPSQDFDEVTGPSSRIYDGDREGSRISPTQCTAIFVHILRYRDICGQFLASLHHGVQQPQNNIEFYQTRNNLAAKLAAWRNDSRHLKLPKMDLTTPLAEAHSSFLSEAWYELLYYNGILLLYRPSTISVEEMAGDGPGLEDVFEAAKQSIIIYGYLVRSRKINFSPIVLHSVFLAGLSYIYSLSRHFREKRQTQIMGNCYWSKEPTMVEIAEACRTCSNVLVGVSERCSTQRDYHSMFGLLSNALMEDAVKSYTSQAHTQSIRQPGLARNVQKQKTATELVPMDEAYQQPSSGALEGPNQAHGYMPFQDDVLDMPLATDNALRMCFTELQGIHGAEWSDESLLQLGNQWLDEIGLDNVGLPEDWSQG